MLIMIFPLDMAMKWDVCTIVHTILGQTVQQRVSLLRCQWFWSGSSSWMCWALPEDGNDESSFISCIRDDPWWSIKKSNQCFWDVSNFGMSSKHISWGCFLCWTRWRFRKPFGSQRDMSQVWGSLNDAAVPILGLFLLRGEDEYFFACHGLREKGNKFQLMYLMFLHNLYMQNSMCQKSSGSWTYNNVLDASLVTVVMKATSGCRRFGSSTSAVVCKKMCRTLRLCQTLTVRSWAEKSLKNPSSKIISSAEFKVQKPREFTVFHINSACFGGVLLTNPFGIW